MLRASNNSTNQLVLNVLLYCYYRGFCAMLGLHIYETYKWTMGESCNFGPTFGSIYGWIHQAKLSLCKHLASSNHVTLLSTLDPLLCSLLRVFGVEEHSQQTRLSSMKRASSLIALTQEVRRGRPIGTFSQWLQSFSAMYSGSLQNCVPYFFLGSPSHVLH